jgi:hypothetical protein
MMNKRMARPIRLPTAIPTIVVMEGLLFEEDELEDFEVDVGPAPAVLVGGFLSPVVHASTVAGAAAAVYP